MSCNKIVIRRARLKDLQALVSLEETCFVSDRLSPRQIRYWINHSGGYFLVALGDSRLAGAALGITRRNSKFIRLYSLAVLPAFRRQGISSSLLQKLEMLALTSGKVGIRLEVRADHAAVIQLYGSMGYQQSGFQSDYYQDHSDAIRMQKILASEHR